MAGNERTNERAAVGARVCCAGRVAAGSLYRPVTQARRAGSQLTTGDSGHVPPDPFIFTRPDFHLPPPCLPQTFASGSLVLWSSSGPLPPVMKLMHQGGFWREGVGWLGCGGGEGGRCGGRGVLMAAYDIDRGLGAFGKGGGEGVVAVLCLCGQ